MKACLMGSGAKQRASLPSLKTRKKKLASECLSRIPLICRHGHEGLALCCLSLKSYNMDKCSGMCSTFTRYKKIDVTDPPRHERAPVALSYTRRCCPQTYRCNTRHQKDSQQGGISAVPLYSPAWTPSSCRESCQGLSAPRTLLGRTQATKAWSIPPESTNSTQHKSFLKINQWQWWSGIRFPTSWGRLIYFRTICN